MGGIVEETGTITLSGANDSDTVDIELFPETGYGSVYALLITFSGTGTAYTTFDYELFDRKYDSQAEDGTNTIAKDDTVTPADAKIVNKTTSTLGVRPVKNQAATEQGYISAKVKGNGGDVTSAYTVTVKVLGISGGW